MAFPQLKVIGERDREERMTRLLRAVDIMASIVRIVWPADGLSPDPLAVRWEGAVLSIIEDDDELTVTWADEDHLEKYRAAADLAWAGLCESGRQVRHSPANDA